MAINIRSYNQIVGDIVRKIIADTPLNDVNVGSTLLSLIEAVAQVDFENSASMLNVLELLNIDAVKNSDLDNRAADFGLSRTPAKQSTGFVTLGDSSISKRSTGLYQVKLPPIAGATQIFVNDASDWAATGQLFIGRGTANFEGPIPYTSIVNNTTFFTINLGAALQKDHLISDVVVDAQGTIDRLIPAGTLVQIPANNLNPAVQFQTLRSAIIPSGEDTVSNIDIVSVVPGSKGNAGINTITSFVSLPFTGATITNTTALTNGSDVESDDNLRERIKSYASTLARGTQGAILASIIGVSDATDSKQVYSAVITEPANVNDPSIVYIDDGSGFQPSYAGQSVDIMLSNASGNEEFLQLANYPLPRPQAVNIAEGPYELADGMKFRVIVDEQEEEITFSTSQFVNIAAATLSEVIIAINNQSSLFKATFTENSARILVFPLAHDAEIIQVSPLKSEDDPNFYANSIFKFPTNEFSYIRLYQNNTLLHEKERAASLLTTSFSTWNITASGSISISVDGTPAQTQTFTTSDFGGAAFATLSLDSWVTAFNNKFAGVTAEATSSGAMKIVSNRVGSLSALEIIGGTYFNKWFTGQEIESVGQDANFELNRQTGNLRILTDIEAGDSISAGTSDAKGNLISSATTSGAFNLSNDTSNRVAEMVVVADSSTVTPRTEVILTVGNTITISDQGSSVMRIMSSTVATFEAAQPGDFIYIVNKGSVGTWVDPDNTGIYKIHAKGGHTSDGVDSYIEVKNLNIVPGTHPVEAAEDIQVFGAHVYPQLWKSSFTAIPASATLQDVVNSINNNLVNVKASIFKTNSLKLTSATEDNGSISIPVSVGRATLMFDTANTEQEGNASHIANRVFSKDAVSFFKRTEPTATDADAVSGKLVWLDRVTYSDIKGSLTSSAQPGVEGSDTYSEELQASSILTEDNTSYDDIYNSLSGSNKGHYRSIRDKISGDKVGTQYELPATLMDHISGDKFNLMRPTSISSEDSIVFILDKDAVTKTVDIPLSRRGKINSLFPATDVSFSADDVDNEPGITFSNLQVWGKTTNNTEFENYAVWMRARNWYVSGGAGSGGGAFVVRSKEYGPHGEKLRFKIEYPTNPLQVNKISHTNTPDFTTGVYTFGSNLARSTGVTAGDSFTVTNLGGDQYRYTFTGSIDLTTVLVNDILSIQSGAGVTLSNRGTFSIKAVNIPGKTLDIYNPNGAVTAVGSPEVTSVTTVADVLGSQTVSTISNITSAAAINGKWFKINDSAGTVAVYYNAGTPNPGATALGVNRVIEVGPLTGAESAATVTALTSGVISADPLFDASYLSTTVTVTNVEYGANAVATDGTTPTGFTFGGSLGSATNSLNEKYFILRDSLGTVAFWYDTTGIAPEPLHGASRAVRITTVNSGDSANTIATKTAVVITNDTNFSATVLSNVVTVTDAQNGARLPASAGTSGFVVAEVTPGADSVSETITEPASFLIFPLLNTSVTDIVTKINESSILIAAEIDIVNPILKATREEEYTPAGPNDYSASLAYGHDPDPDNLLNEYVSFYDGISWVKDFSNLHPNFALKTQMTLQGVAPSTYSMVTAPNSGDDIASTGEFFKLVPVTLNNIKHHFTHKALSQLPIIAEVDIASNIRKIQVKSKLLGSQGAIEVVGGNANAADFSVSGESQVVAGLSKNFLETKIAAFPVTLTTGDIVKVSNDLAAQRKSRLLDTDTIDVVKVSSDSSEYRFNPKNTLFNQYTRFTITDVSTSHGRPANTVWRWTHNDGGANAQVLALANGAPSQAPSDEIAAGGSNAVNLQETVLVAGSVSTPQQFNLNVSALPTQGDYYTFRSAGGVTFAVWFSIDGNVTAPTGTTYTTATNQIMISILSSDSESVVVAKLAATLGITASFLTHFAVQFETGYSLEDVVAGDMLNAYGTFTGWSSGNKSRKAGDSLISGFPIILVNEASRYVDVVNTRGVAMSNTAVGATGNVAIYPSPFIKWNLRHSAKISVTQVILAAPFGTATVTTDTPHGFKEGDSIILADNGIAQTATVVSVPGTVSFTFTDSTGSSAATYIKGNVILASDTVSRYKIESLGFNSLYRLQWTNGNAPGFIDCGAAIDDMLVISGSTFSNNNTGTYRILGITNDAIVFENSQATEALHTYRSFNNLSTAVTWTANFNEVTGSAGNFKNIVVGDWVKKEEDDETMFVQVIDLLDNSNIPVSATAATKILLGSNYSGVTAIALGIAFNEVSDVDQGVYLKDMEDIYVMEGDSARIGDTIFVDKIASSSWFNTANSGSFAITALGNEDITFKPFLRIKNSGAIAETNRSIGVSTIGFFLIENENYKYESIRQVEHTAIDPSNSNRRVVYLTPAVKADKISETNMAKISSLGKLEYSTDVTTGIDGYLYYTGLLRTVQRIIDGYEPDPITYPGRRAVGGLIEILPPLIKRITVSIQVTTNEGVNLNEISNDIKSAIINYVDSLGVGKDVILSEIIVAVMSITGVESVVFINPTPSTQRISVADNEKSFVEPGDVTVA